MPLQSPNNKIIRERFRWLFVAFFEDGHVIQQTEEDKCLSRNDGTGSAFTDVLEYSKESPLLIFELRHIDGSQVASVDLKQGAFIVNGTALNLHNQNFEPKKYNLELIYFRETRVEQIIHGTVKEDMNVEQTRGKTRHYVNRYFIGWQCIVNGRNKQVTLAVG